jgi:hypothetical protein
MTTKIILNATAERTGLSVKRLRCHIANGILSAHRLSPRAIRVDGMAEDTRTGSPLSIPGIALNDTALGRSWSMRPGGHRHRLSPRPDGQDKVRRMRAKLAQMTKQAGANAEDLSSEAEL